MDIQATSFPPIIGFAPRILILGTMPGMESLKQQRYYAHPRNAFWPIMTAYCERDSSLVYAERCEMLKQARIALWDVLKSCRRPGSLDQHIEPDSMIANDLVTFLQDHTSIERIFFNGGKAEQLFKRHISNRLNKAGVSVTCVKLPSTSPAHAAMSYEKKQQIWHQALSIPPMG